MKESSMSETLEAVVKRYYEQDFLNCSETIIHAGNAYYHLDLHEEDMKMMGGFGSGMFCGYTCGTMVAAVAVISKLIVKTKAHDHLDQLRPIVSTLVRTFRQELGGDTCAQLRPKFHTKETRCLNTCLAAARVLEKTVNDFHLAEGEDPLCNSEQ